jgi:hypothetical protein
VLLADVGAISLIGFIIGPVFGFLASLCDFNIGAWNINEHAATGFI